MARKERKADHKDKEAIKNESRKNKRKELDAKHGDDPPFNLKSGQFSNRGTPPT